jgi:hypothetical protein
MLDTQARSEHRMKEEGKAAHAEGPLFRSSMASSFGGKA